MTSFTVAVSEAAFQRIFRGIVDSTHVTGDFSDDSGTISAVIDFRLANGDVDFRAVGGVLDPSPVIAIRELDVLWERFDLRIRLDLPNVCVGGFCVLRDPFSGRCAVRAPTVCVFEDTTDVDITIPIGALVRTEISATAGLSVNRVDSDDGSRWEVRLTPKSADIDLMDWPDIIGDMVEAIRDAVNVVTPLALRPFVFTFLGPLPDLVRNLLDAPDDFGEWLNEVVGVSLGVRAYVEATAQGLVEELPAVYVVPTPYPMLPEQEGAPQVTVEIEDLKVEIRDDEIVLTVEIEETEE